ncbi:hypothetical protein L1987_13713 [Smallanthus sonchifolius]|uniref:Uncharacterized protein n=1 Tax=Smallanthus sonchifolius TaxID=185202 RepID=A0ACB9JI77_9ASTR|nr:hypothetical protein L1987_13713 [Smallanthus sonchifolius]
MVFTSHATCMLHRVRTAMRHDERHPTTVLLDRWADEHENGALDFDIDDIGIGLESSHTPLGSRWPQCSKEAS